MENKLFILNKDKKYIFNIIQKNKPMTKNDILLLSEMKLSTLNRVMRSLEENGLIVECGIGESSGGRKPSLYDINLTDYFVIGIDISRTCTEVVVTDLKMNIRANERFAMNENFTPERTVDRIALIIETLLGKLNIKLENVLGAGLGTVGPIERASGIMTTPEKFQSDLWKNVPIKNMLEKKIGLTVLVDNGANTAVLGEFLFGGEMAKSLAYINFGLGIRTSSMSSGHIVRTINDIEDAFAHMVVDIDGDLCTCGKYGCIECYSSINAIERKFKSEIKKGKGSIVNKTIDEIDFMDICQAAEMLDKLACEIIINAAVYTAAGLSNYINLLGPELIILSGPLALNSNLFYKTCIDTISNKNRSKVYEKVRFSRGGILKDSAIAVGAAAMFIESCLGRL